MPRALLPLWPAAKKKPASAETETGESCGQHRTSETMTNLTNSAPPRNHSAVDSPESEAGKVELLWQQVKEQNRLLREQNEKLETLLAQRDPDRLDDLDEAADLLNVSRRTVETLCHSGELPSVKIRRRRLIPHKALKAFIRRKAES